jgi:hypothetical protein
MEFIKDWFLGVAGAAMIGVFALAITPQSVSRKGVQIASALLLIIAVLRPFTGWSGTPLPDMEALTGESGAAAVVRETRDEILSAIIEEKTSAYIVTKAQALGLVVSVSAQSRMGEFYPEPWAVTIRSDRPEHARGALSGLIELDLQIPLSRQRYLQN